MSTTSGHKGRLAYNSGDTVIVSLSSVSSAVTRTMIIAIGINRRSIFRSSLTDQSCLQGLISLLLEIWIRYKGFIVDVDRTFVLVLTLAELPIEVCVSDCELCGGRHWCAGIQLGPAWGTRSSLLIVATLFRDMCNASGLLAAIWTFLEEVDLSMWTFNVDF